jgi:hypothetical protein
MAKNELHPLIQQNMDMEIHWLNDNDYDEDDDYIPEGCSACGGDYPHCTEGCPLFDD